MKDADKYLLDGLALVTDLREDEWALVVSEVEKAGGVRQVAGMARVEIERAVSKARTLVEKARPPQDSKPKPVVAPKRKKQVIYTDGRRNSRALMPLGSSPSDYPTDKYELVNPDGTPFKVKKDAEPVAKHPGHANQASHGGKGKGGSSSSDPAGRANTRREDEAAEMVGYGANQTAENMTAHSNEMNQKIYGKDGASKKMTPIDEVELMGINDSLSTAAESLTMLSSGKPQKQYDQIISVRRQLRETRGDAVRQLSPAVRNIAVRAIDKHVAEVDDLLSLHREAWTGVGGTFEKAVEPVEKHPGHASQQSHGGKGGGGSSSAPASGGGGGSASSFKVGDKVEYKVKFGGRESLVRGRVVGVTPKGNLKIKPKNKRDGLGITLDPAKVTLGHSAPDAARSAAGRRGAKTRRDNEMPPTYTSML